MNPEQNAEQFRMGNLSAEVKVILQFKLWTLAQATAVKCGRLLTAKATRLSWGVKSMYRVRAEKVSGNRVFAKGVWLTCIGNKPVSVGDLIYTDGRCVYGFYQESQQPQR